MIHGARFWNDRDHYYIQANNPSEELLRKREEASWLESCGPTAAVNCLAALGYNLKIYCPGSYRPQPEEILMDFFNDPRNYVELEKIRHDVDPVSFPGNRIPQYYPFAVKEVFNAIGTFAWLSEFKRVIQYLTHGYTAQLCLVDPGHYIAAVAHDPDTDEIIFNDSWPGRFEDKNGFNRRLDIDEFNRNVKKFAILYKEIKYD